jgi:hypothetical protein
MFRDKDYQPIPINEIKSIIPSFKVSNYDRWDKAHSKYKLGDRDGLLFVPSVRAPA